MLIETISFKLAVEYFRNLKNNSIKCTNIRIAYHNEGGGITYRTFTDFQDLNNHYENKYVPLVDGCTLGIYVSIASFNAVSKLYGYDILVDAKDINGIVKIDTTIAFDVNDYTQRKIDTDKIVNVITSLSTKYKNILSDINLSASSNMYSVCYAEPGWCDGMEELIRFKEDILYKNIIF